MKTAGLLTILVFAISLGSCKKDAEGSITIHFKAFYDGQPLPMFTTKPFTAPDQLQFSHLSFMLSDLELLDQANVESIKDIELVDLSFNDISAADNGYEIHLDKLPAKSYSGLRFGIGVPPDLNAKEPADFASSHPLSNSGYYWVAWNSYIFMKTEGRLDTIGNNAFDTGFAYHTGTDKLYRVFQSNVSITIEDGKNKEIDILIDYKAVLNGIDIQSNPQNHNPADSVQIKKLVLNLSDALSLVQ